MPRGGALTFSDLEGKLKLLRVACKKCDRAGQYRVAKLIERHGLDANLVDWKDALTPDCPKRLNDRVALMDLCGAWFADFCTYSYARIVHASGEVS
jgi:hypothetical protein